MDFKKVSIAFIGALAAGALFTACPGGEGTLYGECTTDLSCGTGEICHPDAGVCVTTCTDANDCGDEAKTCAAIGDDDDRKVCQCQTDALCAGFAEGLTCDLQSAVCVGDGTGGGGNADSCEGQGQATCDYGDFCNDGECAAAPQADDSCPNFDRRGITWTPEDGTGPVIYEVSTISPISGFCGADSKPFSARVLAYNANGTFPTQRTALQGFFYVRVNGTESDATLLMTNENYRITNGGKNGEFNLTFCAATNLSSVDVGLYFTNGNEVCASVDG